MREAHSERGTSWLHIGLLGAGGLVTAAVLFPVFARDPYPAHRPTCQSNLKQIGLGILQYTQDYDERYPPGGTSLRRGWVQVALPYTKSHSLFYCPLAATEPADDPTQRNYTDYWFNQRLGSQNWTALPVPSRTILSGDGNDGLDATNANYALSSLPPQWLTDARSPAYRHTELMNVVFADGHTKTVHARDIVAAPERGSSFALQ